MAQGEKGVSALQTEPRSAGTGSLQRRARWAPGAVRPVEALGANGGIGLRSPALHYRALPRLGLDDFDLRMAGADLLLEPVAGFGFAVAQEHGAGRNLADEIEQFATIGVGGQVEVLHFTAFGDFAGTAAHDEGSARPGSLEPSAGRVSVGVTDEENGLALVADHAGGEVVGGGVFAHHAGREDKNASAGEAHLLQLSGFKNDQVERLSQLEVAVVAVGAVRFEVVDFRE